MRSIVILGFAHRDQNQKVYDGFKAPVEVWTLNDWWHFHPNLEHPHRVYQIHDNWDGRNSVQPWRDSPDWRERYDKSGAECVLSTPEGVQRERIFDLEKAKTEFGEGFLGSTISFMLADAIWEGVERIEMVGVKMLSDSEHRGQVPNLLWNIETARVRGINVDCPYENFWKEKFKRAHVRWEDFKVVDLTYGKHVPRPSGIVEIVFGNIDETALVELG